MKWITREHPKIDRVACPWLIKKFIDNEAEFIFVPPKEVLIKAKELIAIPYDVPDVELSHVGEFCSFDAFLKKYNLPDPALDKLALIVRAADTDRFDLIPQAAGLFAISAGLSYNFKNDDYEMIKQGFVIYDALYSWCKFVYEEKHNWNPKAS